MALTESQSAKLSATIAENAAAEAKSYAVLAAKSEDFSNQAKESSEAAALSEASAAESAQEATDAALSAAGSASIAETASTNAVLSAKVYASAAAVQDAINAGEIPLNGLVNVVSQVNTSFAIQYKNIAGVATATGNSYPSTAYVNQLSDTINSVSTANASSVTGYPSIAEMSVDNTGAITSQRLSDGTTQFPAIMVGNRIEQVQTSDGFVFQSRDLQSPLMQLSATGGVNMLKYQCFLSSLYPSWAEVWVDNSGNIFKIVENSGKVTDIRDQAGTVPFVSSSGGLAIERSGNIFFIDVNGNNLQLTTDGGNANPVLFNSVSGGYFAKFASQEGVGGNYYVHREKVDGSTRVRQGNSNLVHVLIVGQSLSVGAATVVQPALTTSARYPYGAVTFNGGPKYDSAHTGTSVSSADLVSFVPMVENIGKESTQESDCAGLAERLFQKNGITCTVSACGHSGALLSAISSGTASFSATQLAMQSAYNIATSLGMNYVPYMMLIHGNADASANTSGSTYKSELIKLQSDYQSYLQGLMGDGSFKLTMFIQQFSNANVQQGAANTIVPLIIGNAQYEICRDNPSFVLVGTQYARPYVDKDHLTNNGYRTDGEIAGLSIASYISSGSSLALRPNVAGIVKNSSQVTIPLLGGVGSAVIDTTRVVDPGNYGFSLTGATINSVSISGGNSIIITFTGTPTAVSYAYTGNTSSQPGATTGSRGCVRDSATDVSPITGLPLYNDLVAFSQAI